MAIVSNTADSINPVQQRRIQADSLAFGILFALLLTVVQRLVGLARSLLFCRIMPDEQLGQWSLVYGFLIFFAPLVVLGLPGSFGRYVEHYRQRNQLRTFLARTTLYTAVLSVGALILMSLAGDLFSDFVFGNANQAREVCLIGFVLLIIIWHNFLSELLQSLRQIKLVAWMRFASSITFAVVSLALAVLMGPTVSSVVIGYAIGFIVGSLPGIIYLCRNHSAINATSDLSHVSMWRKILPYAGWVWAINAITNLFGLADRYMLLHCSPLSNAAAQSAVGQYHSGLVLPMMLENLSVLIGGALMPYMAAAWEQGNRAEAGRLLRTTLKLSATSFTFGSVVTLPFCPWLFETVLQGRYASGLSVLPMAFAYYIWFALTQICITYLWCAERGWNSAIALGIGLITNVILNAIFIPSQGIYGAVAATMVANFLALLLIYLFSWKNGWEIDWGVWLTSLLPLVLLTNYVTAMGVLLCLIALILNGNRIFDAEEKKLCRQFVERFRHRFAPIFMLLDRRES